MSAALDWPDDSAGTRDSAHADRVRASRQAWRFLLPSAAVGVVWLVLAARLVQLQWIGQDRFSRQTNAQQTFAEPIPARPGDIVDRHGRLLATTITARSLYVDPSRIADAPERIQSLATAVGLDPESLVERIVAHRSRQFLWIKRRLSPEEVANVRTLQLPRDVCGFRDEYLRQYPQGELAAHVLGLRNIDNQGRGGIEQIYDVQLRGRPGERLLVRDARGRVIEVRDETATAPQPGRTVVLSLDAVIQLHAERELERVVERWKPRGACVIVLDATTSDVLAMASRPTFNPNQPEHATEEAWKNLAISAVYEPGSTFKPFVVSEALEAGLIQRDEEFHCEQGAYRMGGRVLHDHHPYGLLSLTDILVKSSNIGMAKIGERLTNAGIFRAAVRFGFGAKTGIELPGELTGILRPLAAWNFYSTGSVPMGHEIAATPMQVIRAHAALADGGQLTTPRLVLGTRDALEQAHDKDMQATAQVVSQAADPDIARWLVAGPMTQVVQRGTGKAARLPGYSVFGKTGTAQKPDPATGAYSSQLHVSSFLCGAPSESPRVLVLLVVDEPSVGSTHYGGEVAAAAAARILQAALATLRVPPSSAPSR